MRDFAIAYFEEAEHDINSATVLLRAGEFARSVQHSLEAAEKAVKGLLTMRGQGTLLKHDVSNSLLELLQEKEDKKIRESFELLIEIERYVGRARYPTRSHGKIVMPSRFFTEDIAKKCLDASKKISQNLKGVSGLQTKT